MLPLPYYDAESFPFVIVSGMASTNIVNTSTGQMQVLINSGTDGYNGSNMGFFKKLPGSLSDRTCIGGMKWANLKTQAMLYTYKYQTWFADLNYDQRKLLEALIDAQEKQEDMHELQSQPYNDGFEFHFLQRPLEEKKDFWRSMFFYADFIKILKQYG